jgi:serine/threonine protein kinase
MEYVDGEDLSTSLRRFGRMPPDKAVQIARQLCAGVAAAHERGVLHRDLKPANVMLDGNGDVRITDFGIATAAADVGADIAGTPQYMAPELLAGKPASIKSDLYALGLILFEVFTGKRVFDTKTLAELRQLHETPAQTTPVGDRPRSRSGHRAGDSALPGEGSGEASGPRRLPWLLRFPAPIRWPRRSPPARHRLPSCSSRPARAKPCRCAARWPWPWHARRSSWPRLGR